MEGAPPVFWMVLPVTVTLTVFIQVTAWQPGPTVGVAVGVVPQLVAKGEGDHVEVAGHQVQVVVVNRDVRDDP